VTPLGAYLRSRMQRRLFVWFGAAILFTALVVAAVSHLVSGPTGPGWKRDFIRAQAFVGARFERVWDDPAARDELASSLSRELDVGVEVRDADRRTLNIFGHRCRRPFADPAVMRDGHLLGSVALCTPPNRAWGIGRAVLPFGAAVIVLWAFSGLVARRLGRPLAELTRVARDLGAGKLESRVRLRHRHGPGEVSELADVMNDMAARIERQMADQRALLATVSHEIRTPLARMRLLLERARTRHGEDPSFDEIEGEVVAVDDLVAELLASSRLDFGALTPKELEVASLVTEAVERAGVDPTTIDVEVTHRTIEGDATLLARALSNLLENAKRHGKGVSAVLVREEAGAVVFSVEDSGPGLAPGEETKIFEPFYRGRAGETDGRSAGLGLSLVKRIAEAHGGRVLAENRAEGGARIGFSVARR
jgi:two-component system, OmpR family, sensor kinase